MWREGVTAGAGEGRGMAVPLSERPPITRALIESYRHTISRDPSKRKVRYHFWMRGAHFVGKTPQECIEKAVAWYCGARD